ncbi:hypothetical protein [Thermococcus sp.]|uniref:hypothetical protein n=1 Tax=Thermococcus sp. TaxID=35749 RepID=UPI002606B240|nr:hypothetical protein [Thermococcus sp.]
MGRTANLFGWEVNEHFRVMTVVSGILVVGIVFQHSLLRSIGEVTNAPGNFWGLRSMSGLTILLSATSSSFWITASFFIIVLVSLVFRSGIEKGYELTLYSLPYTKLEVFSVKFLEGFILSALIVLLPALVLTLINFSDVPAFLSSLLRDERFWGFLILMALGVLYVVSVVTLLSLSLRSMLATILSAFSLVIIPYLINAGLPPANLFNSYVMTMLGEKYFSLAGLITSKSVVIYGLLVPAVLIVSSAVLAVRRDVK